MAVARRLHGAHDDHVERTRFVFCHLAAGLNEDPRQQRGGETDEQGQGQRPKSMAPAHCRQDFHALTAQAVQASAGSTVVATAFALR